MQSRSPRLALCAGPLVLLSLLPTLCPAVTVTTSTGARSRSIPRLVGPETRGGGALHADALPWLAPSPTQVGQALSCENDGVLDPTHTLLIHPGDAAGTIFSVASLPRPFRLVGFDIGLLAAGSTSSPVTLGIDVYEDDLAGFFRLRRGFDLTVEVAELGGHVQVDVTEFGVWAENDLLILISDRNPVPDPASPTGAGYAVPAGDSTPRCRSVQEEPCSVHFVADVGSLFLYGLIEPACIRDPDNVELWDVVLDLIVDDGTVALERPAWGALKARY